MGFISYDNLDEILEDIKQQPIAFLYIVTTGCSVCHGLQPQVEAIFEKFPEVHGMVVDSLKVPEVAAEFQALTAPVLLLFVEGKEYLRKARMINTKEFEEDVKKIVHGYIESQA